MKEGREAETEEGERKSHQFEKNVRKRQMWALSIFGGGALLWLPFFAIKAELEIIS